MSMTHVVVATVILALSAPVIVVFLRRHADRGGASEASASETAAQALAWSDAFRGAASKDNPAWDGHSIELAPPQEHF